MKDTSVWFEESFQERMWQHWLNSKYEPLSQDKKIVAQIWVWGANFGSRRLSEVMRAFN